MNQSNIIASEPFRLTFLTSYPKKETQELDYPISYSLTLLDNEYAQDTSDNLRIEFILVEIIFLLSLFARQLLITASLLDLPQIDDEFPVASI